MYKRMFLLVLIVALVAGFAVAEGAQEEDPAQRDWNRGPGSFDPEMLELTGTVMLQDGEFPVLKSGGEEYVLMYPYYLDDDIEVEDGEKISVEGFIAPHPRRGSSRGTEDDVTYLRLTRATIDGEEYEIPFGPRGGMGPRGYRDKGRGFSRGGCCGDNDDFRGRGDRRSRRW